MYHLNKFTAIMKRIISLAMALVLVCAAAFAQNNERKEGWQEKIRSAQIAMITSELDLSEAEAQAFWPVYNAVQKERHEAFGRMRAAQKALREALDSEDVAKANVNGLLSEYLDAKQAFSAVEASAIPRFKAVLPVEKVAKLVLAQEKFRNQQLDRLGHRHGQGSGQGRGEGAGQGERGGRPSHGEFGPRGGHRHNGAGHGVRPSNVRSGSRSSESSI